MTEPIKWYEPKHSNEFLTFEDVDKMMKNYNPTEFRRQYLNEPQFSPEQTKELKSVVNAGRGTGKTTRDLKHLCELLVSGETKIYCKIKRHRDFKYMSQMFAKLIYNEVYRNFGTRLILLNIEESFSRITTNFGVCWNFLPNQKKSFFEAKTAVYQ